MAALLLLTGLMGIARAQNPIPEAGFLEAVPAAPCEPESEYDVPNYYPGACERLRFVYGPITVKPGQNDLLITPPTIEQPRYDGYITRFEPNLIDATGKAPPVETLHLHHGTWLNAPGSRSYGDGPFMASGEEKTIAFWPKGYGMKVLRNDAWLFLYMVHNALINPTEVWITYDVDFVPAAAAEAIQPDTGRPLITNTRNIWLDVGGGSFHPETETYPFNPVYNTQRGYGDINPFTGKRECSYPSQNCATFNSLGNVSAQQGKAVDVAGKDNEIGDGELGAGVNEGTLVVMGGHLHPGGLYDKVDLVRKIDGVEQSRTIHISEAFYWNEEDGTKLGGRPTSWDFSMTGVSKDIGWSIKVKRGDKLRLNAVYETEEASWYENMGIVMAWVAPNDTSGIDPFAPNVEIKHEYPIGAKHPTEITPTCVNDADTICTKGQITHTQYPENQNHGSCDINSTCQGLTDKDGPEVDRIDMAGFTYGVADQGVINQTGIPLVRKNRALTFTNLDTFDYMWHTATRCKYPCNGPTTVDYPIANGGSGIPGDVMDFDSSELGYGLYPAQRADWTLVPDKVGTYTFFCRIHPGMRGAFKVIEGEGEPTVTSPSVPWPAMHQEGRPGYGMGL